MGLSFTIAAGPRQRSHSQVPVPPYSWSHFTVLDSILPNLKCQIPAFISPRNRVARLYPQALDSLFIASYDSQGYGWSIRPRFQTDWVENTVLNATSNVACVSVAAGTWLPWLSTRFWIINWFDSLFYHITRDYILQITVTHRLVCSVHYSLH
jgi:hypothetical protein